MPTCAQAGTAGWFPASSQGAHPGVTAFLARTVPDAREKPQQGQGERLDARARTRGGQSRSGSRTPLAARSEALRTPRAGPSLQAASETSRRSPAPSPQPDGTRRDGTATSNTGAAAAAAAARPARPDPPTCRSRLADGWFLLPRGHEGCRRLPLLRAPEMEPDTDRRPGQQRRACPGRRPRRGRAVPPRSAPLRSGSREAAAPLPAAAAAARQLPRAASERVVSASLCWRRGAGRHSSECARVGAEPSSLTGAV